MLLIGGSLGRLVGLLMMMLSKELCSGYMDNAPTDGDAFYWSAVARWRSADCRLVDPGLYAVIGSAAFMGGSGRITLFLATVLLELTNDIRMLPPIAFAVIVAMWTGNKINHGLYHALIPL